MGLHYAWKTARRGVESAMKVILVMSVLIGTTLAETRSDPISPPQCKQRKYETMLAAQRFAQQGFEFPIKSAECVEVPESVPPMVRETAKFTPSCPPKTNRWKPRC